MKIKFNIFIFAILIIFITVLFYANKSKQNSDENEIMNIETSNTLNTPPNITPAKSIAVFASPIDKPYDRATKKIIGTYVSPKNSPINPEKFTGYHTGVDFETFTSEKDSDVPIFAICTGKLIRNQFGRGYGGMTVQACEFNGTPVTVVYGHIRLSSITAKIGDALTKGEQFAVLGTGYSPETDGERKHLHLGIHKGSNVNTSGYIADKSLLSNWISILPYIQ